jgi:hypothetical protein
VIDAEIIEDKPFRAAPAPPSPAAPSATTPPKRKKRRWLIAAGVGGGGLLACVVLCAGIGAMATASRSGASGDGDSSSDGGYADGAGSYSSDAYASTDYTATPDPYASTGSTPAPDPYASTGYTPTPQPTYDPYATSGSSYATAPATDYAASQDYSAGTYSQAPSITDTSSYDSTAAPLWSFDRASELRDAIAQDQARLKDLDILIFGADAGSITGEAAAGNEQSRLDQLLGPWLRRGSEAAKRRLETERAEVQIRLNANLAELSRLEQGY